MPTEKLLVAVEDSFQVSGRGVVIEPPPTPEDVGVEPLGPSFRLQMKSVRTARVRLVRPDGAVEEVEAQFSWAHFNPGGFQFMCLLPGAKKEQVPPGTQMWLLEE